jgi:tRNA nucleotidyltransferase (CCA-adding enzyme)
MSGKISLVKKIEKQLPAGIVGFIRLAGKNATEEGQNLYLVGGVVRDLLLGRRNTDLDLVTDSDAIRLARKLAAITGADITVHNRFNTAKLRWNGWQIDFATVRAETYDRPGALPRVKSGTLATDMFRRDFTVNALAIDLTSGRYGQIIDLYGGLADLEKHLIRVLHYKSFIDDATRIWRAIRYEQRLGFHLERNTKQWLTRDLPMLETISGDRIRHELELVMKEEQPEKVLRRAGELGILTKLHPSLKADNWLATKFRQARRLSVDITDVYFALLCYRMTFVEAGQLVAYLKLNRKITGIIEDTLQLKKEVKPLNEPVIPNSKVYNLLKKYSSAAVAANRLVTDSILIKRRLALYLNKLYDVKPVLTGDDLNKMGIPPGPKMKDILDKLLEARLDGKVKSRKGEVGTVERMK